ncbi:MAG: hypothetical protein NZ821_08650, partial [Gloeomargarita sp. SKYB31]|nr:hypothetical protein [Gloeomargarita sp. SKYB31]
DSGWGGGEAASPSGDMEQKPLFDIAPLIPLTARRKNVLRSPKQHGSSLRDSRPYLEELGVEILDAPQPIQFQPNTSEPVHRWSPYVQGFSAQFVQRTLDRYRHQYGRPVVADPFVGRGTVTVQAKIIWTGRKYPLAISEFAIVNPPG